MLKNKILWMVVVLSIGLHACSPSEEEAFEDADRKVREAVLAEETREPNHELNAFQIYLPDSLEISEEDQTNVVFSDGDQPYVLFINEFEEPNSKYLYNNLPEDDEVYLSTIETEDAFSYILIQDREEETYELSVGIGGIKMTTLIDVDHLTEESELMIEMIRSIQEKQ